VPHLGPAPAGRGALSFTGRNPGRLYQKSLLGRFHHYQTPWSQTVSLRNFGRDRHPKAVADANHLLRHFSTPSKTGSDNYNHDGVGCKR